MLLAIREKAQGWIAWAIVIFISIPFALWGIQEYLGVGGEPVVAKVNDREITERQLDQRTREQREWLRERLGNAYRADLFPEADMKREVLDRTIDNLVLVEATNDWNLRMGDEAVRASIRSIPSFQNQGQFDPQAYEIALRNSGLTSARFEEGRRQDLVLAQLRKAITDSAFITKQDLELTLRLQGQKRRFDYVTIPLDPFLESIQVGDDSLQAHYQKNAEQYRIEERVKVDYLLLDIDTVARGIEVSDIQLQDYFEQHRNEFHAPEERKARHILFKLEKGADEEAEAKVRQAASEVREQLIGGASFEEMAKLHSSDSGSADIGGDIGWIEPGLMGDEFDKAAFALPQGEVSEPVKTSFGYHLIQIDQVRGGSDATLADVKDQVDENYRRSEAERLFYDQAEQLADLSYENPDSLDSAVEMLGLEIRQSDWIPRSGVTQGDLASPKVVAAAFSEDVLKEGRNSEIIELAQEKLIVLRTTAHEETRLPSFDEVKAQVTEDAKHAEAIKAAATAGKEAMAQVKGGANLAALAEEKAWQFKSLDLVDRTATDVPAEIRKLAFDLAKPSAEAPSYGEIALANGGYSLIALHEVMDGEVPKEADSMKAASEIMARRLGDYDFNAMTKSLRAKADIEITLTTPSQQGTE